MTIGFITAPPPRQLQLPPHPPIPNPQPPSPSIYNCDIGGRWKNGHQRKVTGWDPDCPQPFQNGQGFIMAASGNPRCYLFGNGICQLEADAGHGRFYVDFVNYEGAHEFYLTFMDQNINNSTQQYRSRHQEGGANTNKFGGLNFVIDRSQQLSSLKVELYHSTGENHINGPDVRLPKPINVGQTVRVRNSYINSSPTSVIMQQYIDYLDGKGYIGINQWNVQLPDYAMYKPMYQQRSYFWIRVNNNATGKIQISNSVLATY